MSEVPNVVLASSLSVDCSLEDQFTSPSSLQKVPRQGSEACSVG